MKKSVLTISTSLLALTLTACSAPTKQDWAILGGAVVGGMAAPVMFGNSSMWSIIGGAAIGGFAGSLIGKSMDQSDRHRVGYTLNNAPDKQPYKFMRSEKDSDLTITPTRSYKVNSQLCRDFQTTLNDAGKTVYEKGSACQQQDGSWQIRA